MSRNGRVLGRCFRPPPRGLSTSTAHKRGLNTAALAALVRRWPRDGSGRHEGQLLRHARKRAAAGHGAIPRHARAPSGRFRRAALPIRHKCRSRGQSRVSACRSRCVFPRRRGNVRSDAVLVSDDAAASTGLAASPVSLHRRDSLSLRGRLPCGVLILPLRV